MVIDQYREVYPELVENSAFVLEQFQLEEERFQRTLRQGQKEFDKAVSRLAGSTVIDGLTAFHLYDTYGYPIEITMEMAAERGLTVDKDGFDENFKKHQQNSHAGAEQRFKGGLADHSAQTARLHTATHLLHAALRQVLGDEVAQKGSNITAERLRFDFSFHRKVTKEELKQVEDIVNANIQAAYPITVEETTVEEAKQAGAIGLFESKYGERVKVYTMGPASKEICGGPHASNTAELVSFKGDDGFEHIWQGDPKYWGGHAPVLFPIVGALRNGRTRIKGEWYEMNRHGFVRRREFTVAEKREDAVSLVIESDAETKKQYPFDFRLTVFVCAGRQQHHDGIQGGEHGQRTAAVLRGRPPGLQPADRRGRGV